jgi:predicted nuclease with TOPRIM domain
MNASDSTQRSEPASGRTTSLTTSLTRPDDAADLSEQEMIREGRLDGRAGVEPNAFSTALGHRVARDRLAARIQALDERISDVNATISAIETTQRNGAAAETQTKILLARAQDLEERRSDIETSIEAVEQEQHAKSKRGSLLYASLYSIAGIFFIAGDVIMSREIVANALKLPGSVEPWIFAIGLAMLAILVKPAYDRLVEERYWKGESGWFTGTIAVCSIGALSTLWILGAFRSTAFVSNTKIQRLTTELLRTEDPARIADIEAQIGVLQQSLIESPLGYWAFVLSGVLFALAGAVCLGIGFRHIRDAYHLRWSLYQSRKRLRAEHEEVSNSLTSVQDDIERHRVEQSRARQALNDQPPLKALREQRDTLRDDAQKLLDEHAEAHADHLEAVYRRAHAQGEKGLAPQPAATGDGAPEVSVHAGNGHAGNGTLSARATDKPEASRNGSRPHEELRSIIRRHR